MFTIGSMLLGPLISSAAGGIANGIGNVAKSIAPFASSGLDFLGGLLTNQSNADEAARNRRFVAKMYKKRYQFTVEDMRKAGLNPILATNGGSVGSAPTGSMATFTNPVHGALSSAVDVARSLSDINAQTVANTKTSAEKDYVVSKTLGQDLANKVFPEKMARQLEAISAATAANNARSSYIESQNRWIDALSKARLAESNSRLSLFEKRAKLYDRQIKEGPQGYHNYIVNQISPWNKELGRFIHSASDLGSAGLKIGTFLRGL